MFEESLVIILLLAIFFVVFYIIYNNSCGCNKSLIEKFEVDSTNPIFSNAIEQINQINGNISRIDKSLRETNGKISNLVQKKDLYQDLGQINNKIHTLEETLNNFKNEQAQFFERPGPYGPHGRPKR